MTERSISRDRGPTMFSRRNRLLKQLRDLDRELEALEAQKDSLDQNAFLGKSASLFLRRGVIKREIESIDARADKRPRGNGVE